MFITFYSYKGGVGRSLALANLACLMAQDEEHPQRVLVWDFDLEAPGVHRLFPPKEPQNYGFVDLAYEYAKSGSVPIVDEYIYESEVSGIHVLPAGKIGESYCERLRQIDWLAFFGSDRSSPGPLFGKLLESIRERKEPYDYVLVDSRTGLNDQAGICTQVIPDLVIVLFRLSAQNLDGLEHLVPAIRSQLEARSKTQTQILPIASQVGVAGAQGLPQHRKRAREIFRRPLEYIRFDQDLVSKEKLFCLHSEMAKMWPCPPIVDDYRRICSIVREKNAHDTRSQARALRSKLRDGDSATASAMLLRLLPRRPRLYQAWNDLASVFEEPMPESRRKEFRETVDAILREDPENFFAYKWKAAFQSSEARTPDSEKLVEAKESLQKALKYSGETGRDSIYRAISSIESCQGNLQSAVKALRNAQALSPENNQISLDLAMMHMRIGEKYFAVAAEELDATAPDIGDQKYVSLAYLRTFLGEEEKAAEALKSCDTFMLPLVKAHMFLIRGDRKKALELAEKEISREDVSLGLVNWAEFYVCSGDFSRALSLIETISESGDVSKGDVKSIGGLAKFFKSKKKDFSSEMNDLVSDWEIAPSWNFRELLMFRERSKREGNDYGGRLVVIEELIKIQELKMTGLFGMRSLVGVPRFKRPRVRLEIFTKRSHRP